MKLTHGEQIRTTMDTYNPVITIGTAKGFEAEYGKDTDKIEAWTTKHAAYITADYPGKANDLAEKREAYKNAVLVRNGDVVEIEGHIYTAKYNSPNVSDPITFVRD